MATCKDCLYYKICSDEGKAICDNFDDELQYTVCLAFKDKSRYIELPCKFLQKCFVVPTIDNRLNEITEMKCIGFAISNDSFNSNLITDKNKLYQPCFEAFGKTVFLTREEAEKTLKEREQE